MEEFYGVWSMVPYHTISKLGMVWYKLSETTKQQQQQQQQQQRLPHHSSTQRTLSLESPHFYEAWS
jgi:hypothetical protein